MGLHAGTHSKVIVLGGILTIAIADACSDALGIHIAEESENTHNNNEIWASTLYTFLFKFLFSLTFIVPLLLFNLSTAIIISVIWGLSMLSIFSYFLVTNQKTSRWKVVLEHLIIALIVILITHLVGDWVSAYFG